MTCRTAGPSTTGPLKDAQPLYQIGQLANVPRPGIGAEGVERFVGEDGRMTWPDPLGQMGDQCRQILHPLP